MGKGNYENIPRSANPETVEYDCMILGASGACSLLTGSGITVTYGGGSGLYTLTLPVAYKEMLSFSFGLMADTPGDLKNFGVVIDSAANKAFDSTGKIIKLVLYNASGTGTDLAAAQQLSLTFKVRTTTVKGG